MFHTSVLKDFKAKQINQRNTRTRHFCRHHSSFYRLFVLKSIHTKMLICQSKNIKPENTFNIRHQMPTCCTSIWATCSLVYLSDLRMAAFLKPAHFFYKCLRSWSSPANGRWITAFLMLRVCLFFFNLTYSCGLCRPKPPSQITNINNTIVDF